MKKFLAISIVFLLAIMFTVPAMAVEADFKGAYRVRGWSFKYNPMDPNNNTSTNSYMRMRLRLDPTLKVTDDLSVTARIDMLDGVMYGDPSYSTGAGKATDGRINTSAPSSTNASTHTHSVTTNNLRVHRAYLTYKSPIGGIVAGRMKGGTWGTWFADGEDDYDRLIYVVPVDQFTFAATYEKVGEGAMTYPNTKSNKDNDKYYLSGTYKADNIEAGALLAFYNYGMLPDLAGYLASGKAYGLTPYAIAKFGIFSVESEISYYTGKATFNPTDLGQGTRKDKDIEVWGAYLQAGVDLSPVEIKAGYAYASGDANTGANGGDGEKFKSYCYLGTGQTFQPLFILTGQDYDLYGSLGGLGNLANPSAQNVTLGTSSNRTTSTDGYSLGYLNVNVKPIDNLTVGLVVGLSQADDVPKNWVSKSHGTEYDFVTNWKIVENLNYQFIGAYLQSGDYFKQTNNKAEIKNPYVFYNELKLSF
ncbi:MAG: hypothetical protein HQK79_07675 [Desulfobacterales bacterium]|nr:hypothetical protein [Desulfobacterales bacterium]